MSEPTAAYSDPVTRVAEIKQENRGGDEAIRDALWALVEEAI